MEQCLVPWLMGLRGRTFILSLPASLAIDHGPWVTLVCSSWFCSAFRSSLSFCSATSRARARGSSKGYARRSVSGPRGADQQTSNDRHADGARAREVGRRDGQLRGGDQVKVDGRQARVVRVETDPRQRGHEGRGGVGRRLYRVRFADKTEVVVSRSRIAADDD